MTWQGGKIREQAEMPSSPFACLQPILQDHERDVDESFQRLARALGTYESPVRIHIRLITDDTIDHWEVEGGSSSAAARRHEPKSADVFVVLRRETWVEIAQGRLAPFDALFQGKLRIGGDVALAKGITQHLSDRTVPFVPPC
ncbi:MAG: SCP2 sterol-binding domain-containing protein [Verrucomicrobiota bacterium]|nr:SCP2 sterol-binding domain-containing protein [Verrucomicrobiota bacterium]